MGDVENMSGNDPKVFLLNCAVQNYAWGKPGSQSEVAVLSKAGNTDFDLKEDGLYAELWMGTHPKGPSVVQQSGETLSSWVDRHPSCVGEAVKGRFPTPGQLPFLFKVLSVNKSLSIQAHPNKSHAEELHKAKPDKYPDPNHKPEMAIALTQFEGLCGFRPTHEIVAFMKSVPELVDVVGSSLVDELSQAPKEASQSALKKCFTAVMTCDPEVIKVKLTSLIKHIQNLKSSGGDLGCCLGDLVLRLNDQFPGDVGCFVVYFLNLMCLQPGEAMFLEANLPHAYLAGDCMECMACSDNVVRAGLTPKFKDVDTLCAMLNYTGKPADENLFRCHPDPADPCVAVFDPPVPDFSVAKIQVPSGTDSYRISAIDGASIVICIQGHAQGHNPSLEGQAINISRGSIFFVAANEQVDLNVQPEGLLLFRAYCAL